MWAFHAVITAGILFFLLHTCLNLLVFRRPSGKVARGTRISVLIPARNEATRIPQCLESLTKQSAALHEILVLDDHSEDATAEIVRGFSESLPQLRLLTGEPLPEGWTGKAWACHQLAAAATGEILVFTDADTRHEPGAIEGAVGWMQAKGADFISLWPHQITETLGEKLVIPFVHVLLLVFLPHWMPGRFRSLGAANGQFIALTRKAYDATGGHEAVRHHLVEDVALARLAKAGGWKILNADGSRLIHCRMYESLPQIFEGFAKNLRAGCDGSVFAFLFLQGCLAVFFLSPFLWLPALPFLDCVSGGLVLFQVVMVLTLRGILGWRVRHPALGVLLHPVGQVLVLGIAATSWSRFSTGRITWKGRTYPGSK